VSCIANSSKRSKKKYQGKSLVVQDQEVFLLYDYVCIGKEDMEYSSRYKDGTNSLLTRHQRLENLLKRKGHTHNFFVFWISLILVDIFFHGYMVTVAKNLLDSYLVLSRGRFCQIHQDSN
jgi:hypothetical protein